MRDVKFGKWCRENGEDWWTGTKEELLMAKKAGHVTDSDRVVVTERKRELGEVVMSVLKWLPGFLPCDGRKFDKEIFSDLYEALGDDHTPDLREAAPVGAGEREADVEHDVFEAGEFKDDAVQRHYHSRGTMEITGKASVLTYTGYSEGALGFEQTGENYVHRSFDKSPAGNVILKASSYWTGMTSGPETTATAYQKIQTPAGNPREQGLYEFSVKYVKTADESVNYSKKYYKDNKEVDLTELANPKKKNWYERDEKYDEAVYVTSEDTSLVIGKTYYTRSGGPKEDNEDEDKESGESYIYTAVDLAKLKNPKTENWLEATDPEYALTEDSQIQEGKDYYQKIESNAAVRTAEVTRGKRFGMNFFIAY